MSAAAIKTGQVWVSRSKDTRTPSRRVIQVINDRICYSTGSDQNRWCAPRAFLVWISIHNAISTRTRRARSLTLCAKART
jgi:hypothetical protein